MFPVTPEDFKLVNSTGDKVLYGGQHILSFSRGNGEVVTIQVPIAGDDADGEGGSNAAVEA